MNKKYAALFTASVLLLTSLSAAENFPTSQFDHDGWYRPNGTFCPAQDAVATPCPTEPAAQPTATPASAPVKTSAPSTGDDYTTPSSQVQEEILLNLLNQERIVQGLSPLTLDAELSRIARIKSADMRDNHYFAHESPTYGHVSDMLKTFGYSFSGAGENIAHHATTEKAHAAFMSSEGHRRNILSSAWQKVGLGIVYDANGYVYVTEIFVR